MKIQQILSTTPAPLSSTEAFNCLNRKKREAKKREQAKLEASGVNQYYGIGAVIALGVIGGLGYYIYRSKKVEQLQSEVQKIILNHSLRCNHKSTSLRWINLFY